jgi:uncharacterized repeat protein (TIGR01451 family)
MVRQQVEPLLRSAGQIVKSVLSLRSVFLAGALATLVSGMSALAQSADVTAVKTGPDISAADTDVAFSITVKNIGDADAGATVTLTDPLPSGMTFVSMTQGSGPAFSCTDPGAGNEGTVTCTIADLVAGASATFTLVGHIPPLTPPGTFFTNTATVSNASGLDATEENDSSTANVSTPPPPQADMAITKAGPSAAGPDTDVTFTISLQNFGPDPATNVSWTDTLPGPVPGPGAGPLTFVSLQQNSGPAMGCTTGGTVTCTVVSFAAGASASFTLVAHVPPGTPAGTEFTNTATVTSDADPTPEDNSSTTAFVVSSSDVGVTKTAPPTSIAGSNLSYTITVSNGGPDAADTTVLSDTLPAGTTFVSLVQNSGPSANCVAPAVGTGGTVTCTFPLPLSSGATAQFTLTVVATASVTNTATVSTSGFDTNNTNDSSSASTTITPLADLSVTKTGSTTVTAGSNATYTVTVANGGPSTATTVSLTDPVPPGATFVSATQTSGPAFLCSGGATITCTIASFASGATASFTFVMSVASPATVNNIATISSAASDPNPTNNSSAVLTTVTPVSDVSVVKTGPTAVPAPSNATYTVTVANAGPSAAANVSMTDTIPAGATFVSANQTAGPAFACTTGATITCTNVSLAAGASATFSIVMNIASPGAVSNTANVSVSTPDPNPTNNTSTASTTAGAATTDLAVTKSVSPGPYFAGFPATYTIVVTNNGPGSAFGVVVTDPLPAGTGFVGASSTQGTCSGTSTVTCTVGTLAVSASATITINVTMPANPGPVTNTATVTASNVDSNPANDSGSTPTFTVQPASAIPALDPSTLVLLAAALMAAGALALRK